MIRDVLDSVKLVADGVNHIRTVAQAVHDGRDYLKLQHPEIRDDLAKMCDEMRKTAVAVAAASAVLTHFRFTVEGSARDSEPARFNEHLIAHKEVAAYITQSLHSMRGRCSIIQEHADKLRDRANSMNLGRMLRLFGIDSAERDRQVADALQEIYNDEWQGYLLIGRLSGALQQALDDIASALGPPGTMEPARVPDAAKLLGAYAQEFSRLESESNFVVLELQQSIDALEVN